MAQIDPSIAMSFRPIQIESPINQMAAVAQLRGAQEASQMNALKMQEYQQQQNERNALSRLMREPGVEFGSDAFMNRVLAEAPSQYEGIATRAAQRENLLAQRETRQAEADKRKREMSIEQFQTAIGELASYDTVDDVLSGVQQKLGLGQITQAQADQVISGLPKTDAELPAWQLRTMRNLLPPKERLADVRAERKDEREAARLDLEDARLRETQRHQQAMESISGTQAERQLKQLEETQRHNKVMEGLDARRVSISAASEARKAEQGGAELSSKEIQKREAARPQATLAIKSIDAKAASLVKDLQELRDHPGLNQITGLVGGRVPGVTDDARAAQALYDRIVARGGFQMLQEMREASKTGGALGNVSNQEGKQLQAAFAALDRRQGKEDLQRVIDQVISDVEGAKIRSKEAYDETYSYRSDRATPAAPAAPKPPAAMSEQDKAALNWANSNPKDPRAAQIKQRLGVKQ
jgi:hypothetical protein